MAQDNFVVEKINERLRCAARAKLDQRHGAKNVRPRRPHVRTVARWFKGEDRLPFCVARAYIWAAAGEEAVWSRRDTARIEDPS